MTLPIKRYVRMFKKLSMKPFAFVLFSCVAAIKEGQNLFHCDCYTEPSPAYGQSRPYDEYQPFSPPGGYPATNPPTDAPLQWALVRKRGTQYRVDNGPWSDSPPPLGPVQGDLSG